MQILSCGMTSVAHGEHEVLPIVVQPPENKSTSCLYNGIMSTNIDL
jgi:hypothetical protein